MNLEDIRKKIDEGYIKETKHPEYPELSIFNYTQVCQFERAWDEVTTGCRGLVMNTDTGGIVAKPWNKFFNLSEMEDVPEGDPIATEKIDGSLGIVFWYDDKWHICTKGSFQSEQAIKAAPWIKDCVFPRGYTHLFEIMYPENKIVVDYGNLEGLVYLESLDLFTGEPSRLVAWPEDWTAARYGVLDKIEERSNREGYVFRWPDGTMAKVKHDEYVRLHKIMSEYSPKRLWEVLAHDENVEVFLKGVPDEFYQQVHKDKDWLELIYRVYYERASILWREVIPLESRKEQAQRIVSLDKEVAPIVFKMLDGKSYQEIIWKKVKEWLS